MTQEGILAEEFANLVHSITSDSQQVQELQIKNWFKEVPAHLKDFAYNLVSIYKAQKAIQINTGAIAMTDKSTKIDTGGGNITGSAIGYGNRVDAEVIQNIQNEIDNSTNIDESTKTLFKNAVKEIGEQTWTPTIKSEVLTDLERVRSEVEKTEPDESLLKKLWVGVVSLAGQLPTIVEIGKWLATKFPFFA